MASRAVRRPRDIVAVFGCHLFQLAKRAVLLGKLLALPQHLFGEDGIVEFVQFTLLRAAQVVHAVKRNAAIIADDPAPAISVRQPCNDARFARG